MKPMLTVNEGDRVVRREFAPYMCRLKKNDERLPHEWNPCSAPDDEDPYVMVYPTHNAQTPGMGAYCSFVAVPEEIVLRTDDNEVPMVPHHSWPEKWLKRKNEKEDGLK